MNNILTIIIYILVLSLLLTFIKIFISKIKIKYKNLILWALYSIIIIIFMYLVQYI